MHAASTQQLIRKRKIPIYLTHDDHATLIAEAPPLGTPSHDPRWTTLAAKLTPNRTPSELREHWRTTRFNRKLFFCLPGLAAN